MIKSKSTAHEISISILCFTPFHLRLKLGSTSFLHPKRNLTRPLEAAHSPLYQSISVCQKKKWRGGLSFYPPYTNRLSKVTFNEQSDRLRILGPDGVFCYAFIFALIAFHTVRNLQRSYKGRKKKKKR